MVEVERRQFRESYSQGAVSEVTMVVKAGKNEYAVVCAADAHGDADHLLFDEARRTGGGSFGSALDTDDITEVVALLDFCEDFAADQGYDQLRTPRIDV